jgi:hypothetical protein
VEREIAAREREGCWLESRERGTESVCKKDGKRTTGTYFSETGGWNAEGRVMIIEHVQVR